MGAVDPTYPLFPIANILSAAMLLLVLLTSLVRQSWNLAVGFLCFWLLVDNVTTAANSIIWSDNADVKLYAYCDIVTHLQVITSVVKPMATLLITRRLYLIANLQSVEPHRKGKGERLWDTAVEWTLCLFVPLLVAGPIYYANQGLRYFVNEGFGCTAAKFVSVLELLTVESWTVIPPLISVMFYYPKVARIYYRQSKDAHSFLRSNSSVSHTNYLRILVLASIDILLMLPAGIVNVTLEIIAALSRPDDFPFYYGWTILHTDWDPVALPYAEQQGFGTAALVQSYFVFWTSPVLAFAIFGLFGLTSEARTSYWRIVCTVCGWFGRKPTALEQVGRTSLGDIEFGARSQVDAETGLRTSSPVEVATAVATMVDDRIEAPEPRADLKLMAKHVDEASFEETCECDAEGGTTAAGGTSSDGERFQDADALGLKENVSDVPVL
ncbi:unnamed protein product [Peniophora sp. CBMAI 1063]|nr:unnamed protein product [Peniophora sp. CBMAI 1063]